MNRSDDRIRNQTDRIGVSLYPSEKNPLSRDPMCSRENVGLINEFVVGFGPLREREQSDIWLRVSSLVHHFASQACLSIVFKIVSWNASHVLELDPV